MGNVNPAILYYDIVLIISIILTGIYMFMWNKHYDAHVTMAFVLVPVVCFGYVLLAHSEGLNEAMAANKVIYLGGCFLQLIILLAVCNLCGVRGGKAGRVLKLAGYLLSVTVFIFVLNPMGSRDFYTHAELVRYNGLPVLLKEYGWMHTVFQVLVVVYFLLSFAVILYSLFKKNQISRKVLALLFFPEVLAFAAFFIQRTLTRTIDFLPAAYVLAQMTYLVIAARIPLYDATDTAVDSLAQNGDTGFLSIDYGYHYLGSNETARDILPVLRQLTVDLSIRRRKSFADLVIPWLEAYRQDPGRNLARYEKGDRVYRVLISTLYNNRRARGYQLTFSDDTRNQQYISLLNNYNEELKVQVEEKTAHIEEMHDKLILGMATMVESRDNSTGGHIRRTSEGVRLLLETMQRDKRFNLSSSFCKKLIKAAPMHDLGKITVDDEVLRKPGRFTPEEYEKMKAHAKEGARIVHEILKGTDDDEFHLIAENVAQFHHERWDGKGYPEGLKGEEIPREARIMAVADVYDALVSKRVYKEKMSFEKADAIMREGMGTQFAPEMEEIYLQARPRLEAYYSSLEG